MTTSRALLYVDPLEPLVALHQDPSGGLGGLDRERQLGRRRPSRRAGVTAGGGHGRDDGPLRA